VTSQKADFWFEPPRLRVVLSLLLPVLLGWPAHAQEAAPAQPLEAIADGGEAIEHLRTIIVAQDGAVLLERGFHGHQISEPQNIKSASKSVISALVGMAIDRGVLEGVEQSIAPLLADDLPENPDPRLQEVTVGNLLSMQAGLEPTSNVNYGRWIASANWVEAALARPFVDEPGGGMLYSTGSTHLLSALLTRLTGKSTLDLAEEWFAPLENFAITGWQQDPQGIYLGGNEMAMRPHSMLAFGELYRRGGVTADGVRLLPESWVEQSWTPRTTSRVNGDGYGYGWFLDAIAGEDVRYAWGYGGQMIYVVPALDLTVVMTSDENVPSVASGHLQSLDQWLADIIGFLESTPAQSSSAQP
jgi:CubicO group peptidase (beta-lactamase class C family)